MIGRVPRILLSVFVAIWLASGVDAVLAGTTGPSPTPTVHAAAHIPTEIAERHDADRDGVPDERDRCPKPLPGASGADASGCPTEIEPFAGLAFNHKNHREWYERYWTGDCDGLSLIQSLICRKDGNYWYRIVATVLEKIPPADRGPARFEIWSLGRVVGHEWAKNNDVRKIDTGDIDAWGNELRATNDALGTIQSIRQRAEEKLR